MINFAEIIQAPMRELQSFISAGRFASPEEGQYAHTLLAFLKSDDEQLEDLAEACEHNVLRSLIALRHQILTNSIESDLIEKLERMLTQASDWQGEIAYTLGLAYLENEEIKHALRCFKYANKRLWDIGARKKAVKALLNIILTEARDGKTNRGVAGFEFVREKAVEVNDNVLTGVCLTHIAKEHAKLKAFNEALTAANQALDLLSDERSTSYFFEALLQRAQVYLELDRVADAQVDLQNAKLSRHARIQDNCRQFERALTFKTASVQQEDTKQA